MGLRIVLGCDRHSILCCGSFDDRVVGRADRIVRAAHRIVGLA